MPIGSLPRRGLRLAVTLAALSCATAVTPLLAQQVSDSARVSPASAGALAGPRLSAPFQSFQPKLVPSNASRASSYASANDQHTIVFSTLALVLAVIVVVLLVVR